MKALHISDWHSGFLETLRLMEAENLHRDEDVELVLITGDMLPNFKPMWVEGFEEEQARRQRGMWCQIAHHFAETWPNAELVAVPGNHDWCDYNIDGVVKSFDKLQGQTFTVGGVKISGFRGVPWWTGHWHGELNDRAIDFLIAEMDFSAKIFLTHTPPYGILDSPNGGITMDKGMEGYVRHVGAIGMEEWFTEHPWTKHRYHCFGHIHEVGGNKFTRNHVTYSNASGTCNVLEIK
jgi:Icc-related predicted phosphoesterase